MIIQVEQKIFFQWLKDGITRIKNTPIINLPIDISCLDITPSKESITYFFMEMPDKYVKIIDKNQSINALIDEVKKISMTTQEQTQEWEARMKNMGEVWLPFEFQADWFKKENTSPRSELSLNYEKKQVDEKDKPINKNLKSKNIEENIQTNSEESTTEDLPTSSDRQLKSGLSSEIIQRKVEEKQGINIQPSSDGSPSKINETALAKRLNVKPLEIRKLKNTEKFPQWSKENDPDGISWEFSAKTGKFSRFDDYSDF